MYFSVTQTGRPSGGGIAAAVSGASFYGTIEDAWYVPLVDIGFEGKAVNISCCHPDYKGDVPDGYIPVRPRLINTMTLCVPFWIPASAADLQAGNDLVKQVKVYPLSKAANPPAQRLLDMSDVMFNGLDKIRRQHSSPALPAC